MFLHHHPPSHSISARKKCFKASSFELCSSWSRYVLKNEKPLKVVYVPVLKWVIFYIVESTTLTTKKQQAVGIKSRRITVSSWENCIIFMQPFCFPNRSFLNTSHSGLVFWWWWCLARESLFISFSLSPPLITMCQFKEVSQKWHVHFPGKNARDTKIATSSFF